jgi:hypothetical protein
MRQGRNENIFVMLRITGNISLPFFGYVLNGKISPHSSQHQCRQKIWVGCIEISQIYAAILRLWSGSFFFVELLACNGEDKKVLA